MFGLVRRVVSAIEPRTCPIPMPTSPSSAHIAAGAVVVVDDTPSRHQVRGGNIVPGHALQPVGAGDRLFTLDVLRGAALLGVVISNMVWFSGLVFRFPGYRAETPLRTT